VRPLFHVPERKLFESRTIVIATKFEPFRHHFLHGYRPMSGIAGTRFQIVSKVETSPPEIQTVMAWHQTREVPMSDFFRVQLGIVSRSEGHSAARRSAYQSCGRIVDHQGQSFDFSRKAPEHVRRMMLAPDGVPEWAYEPECLWQLAAAAEKRVDAQEARILDFSMPRAVPSELWEACIRHVYEPFLRMGMVLQIDIHDTAASDGGRNVNVHGLTTLREIDGNGFAKRKNRSWNDHFRERSGRAVREAFAERLTSFCREHSIDYQGDARPNSERDLPDPEPELPRWNFEASERTGQMPEALAALLDHRKRRQAWEEAQAEEIEAALDLQRLEAHIGERRRRRVVPASPVDGRSAKLDRRAAILNAWHRNGWIDADTLPAIAVVRFDAKRDLLWIDLKDGSTLVDRGDSVTLRGRLTWQAALETAAAAERHGWMEVCVHGDQAYKDAVAVAAMLHGMTVTNHALSPKAQVIFDRLHTAQVKNSKEPNKSSDAATNQQKQASDPVALQSEQPSSKQIHDRITKRRFVKGPPLDGLPEAEESAPVYKPSSTSSKSCRTKPERSVTD
jgi:hypothetical protein